MKMYVYAAVIEHVLVMQQRNIKKDCRVLFGDIFIVRFLGSALGYLTAMYSPGWVNLVAVD